MEQLAGRVPVIGFVGAPFTLASYMIEGGPSKNFVRTKSMMYRDETLWRRLMGKLVDVLGPFALSQVTAGARAIQVFDSWVGALSPDDYVRFVAPYSRALIERIRTGSVPVIHFGTGASGFFRELHAAGGGAAKIVIDNLDLRPAKRRQAVPHGVLQSAALTVVQHLMGRGLPHIK